MITVFTPTYNRAYILPKLFESLVSQTDKNFEWLIVDDGSEDNTAEIVKQFQKQAVFPIRYIYQENQGKHVAINTALENIHTPYFVIVDSDDSMNDSAVEIMLKKLLAVKKSPQFIGLAFPVNILGNKTVHIQPLQSEIEATINDLKFRYGFVGELTLLFKTDLAKDYKYPVFEGEKFMLESVVYNRIDRKYKILYINQSIVNAEYRADGLTAQGKKIRLNNPKGSALAYLEKMKNKEIPLNYRKLFANNFWDYESLSDKNFASKFIKIPGIILKFHMISYFFDRIRKKKI